MSVNWDRIEQLGHGVHVNVEQLNANAVPDDFLQDVGLAMWEAGVDPTTIPLSQRQQIEMALWQDPYLHDLFNQGIAGSDSTDPLTGAPISNFTPYIKKELFDPTQTHSQFLVSQGVTLLQLAGHQLSSNQQNYAQNLGGGDPTVMNALAKAAQDSGVPYNVALATAMAESGLNPNAVGDQGCSHGLFQLNTCGGEGEGMSLAQMQDPYTNAMRALSQFKAVAAQDPSITSDPGRWAATAQRPADPTGYAARVNNLMQSGFGGSPSSLVPKPFEGSFPITEDHNQGDPGVDYGTPVGTLMYTPFSGTIRLEDSGKANWGKRAMVVLDNGYTFAIGHLHSFSVSDGQRVNPGDLLGASGGDPSDPSSGNTTGPHVELQWISPGGNFLDPHIVLDSIFSGTATFRSLNLTGAEGSGVSATSARDRTLGIDPIMEAKYPAAVSAFEKYFGRHPTAQELTNLVGRTGGDPNAIESYMRNQPSHIAGVSMGMYQDVKGNLDAVSQKMFGHGGTDGMVKELVDQGKTSPTSIQYFLTQMDIQGKMDPHQYQNIFKLAQGAMQGVWNEKGFDPRIASAIYGKAQSAGVSVPNTPLPGTTGPSGFHSTTNPLIPPAQMQGQGQPMQSFTAGQFEVDA